MFYSINTAIGLLIIFVEEMVGAVISSEDLLCGSCCVL